MNLLRIVSRLYVNGKRIVIFGASAFIIGLLLGTMLLEFGGIPRLIVPIQPTLQQRTLTLSGGRIGKGAFSADLPELTIQLNVSQYQLPVNLTNVRGYEELKHELQITPEQEQMLSQNGFVVLRMNRFETLGSFYEYAIQTGMPILITTDAVLHVYHVLFDETLKRIEMNDFIPSLNDTINTLFLEAKKEAESLAGTPIESASKLSLMYLEVAHALIDPNFTPTSTKALDELQLISEHRDMIASPIFGYIEDYTQYVPRGHYTENEQLKSYFKTMMWFGRMRFALLANEEPCIEQTQAGILLTWIVTTNSSVYQVWQRIYDVTKFFVGASDDLTFEDYLAVLNESGISSPEQIYDENVVADVSQKLLERNKAKILGTIAFTYPTLPQEEELQRLLSETAGLRFMGQRFIPDPYMFQQLVFTQVGTWSLPRLFPKGLDVPAVLGSDLSKQILDETEAKYENYTRQMEKLRTEFKSLSTMNWTRNLYWSWLYTANSTLAKIPSEAKYPTFMITPAWGYEKLQTFMGTWTELRHDTILYAKQSYTATFTSVPPSDTAYVEPYPETYRRLVGLINMTINGLTHLEILPADVNTSLTLFSDISKLFLNASIIELEGKPLDESMQLEIRASAKLISRILSVASKKTQKAAIAVDVHTDPNTESVLEEALGNFNALVMIYTNADENLYATAGPAYNYFEFIQPMSQRLTDEDWQTMIKTSLPEPPEWTDNFAK